MPPHRNPTVSWLTSRAYGQGGTVSVPHGNSSFGGPRGSFPPGVEDVLYRLASIYGPERAGASGSLEWCFLVGGPGNGKSEALASLARQVGVELPPRQSGAPAPRVVPDSWPHAGRPVHEDLEMAFINDASIPREGISAGDSGSLFLDIRDALTRIAETGKRIALFGNINRGVLIEEINRANIRQSSSSESRLAASVVRWLSSPPPHGEEPSGGASDSPLVTTVGVDPQKPYYGQFRLRIGDGGGQDILVHAVFLDVLSLLEPTPRIGDNRSIDFSVPVAVARYIPFGGLGQQRSSRHKTTAGALMAEVAQAARWESGGCTVDGIQCPAYEYCPFAQNARWLRSRPLIERVLDAFRGAEVAAARRLTYRDLVGHLSLAIVGSLEDEWLAGKDACDWVQDLVVTLDSERGSIARLVAHRVYMNLFPAPNPSSWKRHSAPPRQNTLYRYIRRGMAPPGEASRPRPFERAFSAIDPARDVEYWGGLRNRVLDAVESLEIEAPSARADIWEEPMIPPESTSALEVVLDRHLSGELATDLGNAQTSKAASQRANQLRQWRSVLLLRQVGLATGNLASGPALQAWLSEQRTALRNEPPRQVGHGLKHLLLPATASEFIVAPFRPRTYGLLEEIPRDTFLVPISLSGLQVVVTARGDMLAAEIRQMTSSSQSPVKVLASVAIDLAVAREALLHSSGDMSSFTEIGESSFARIERARATLVGREPMRTSPVYFTDSAGLKHQITENPGGASPLRIEPL